MRRTDKLLVVGAHPDDCEFGAGGTSFEWARLGTEVHFAVVTDGSKGSADRLLGEVDLVKLRESEQRAAAAHLGVAGCHFLGFLDGEVSWSVELHRALVKLIRELKPHTVLTHSPEPLDHRAFSGGGPSVNHRDHRAVGQCVLDAVYPSARNPNEFQELDLPPHCVEQVGLWGARFADASVVCEEGVRRKAQALALHRSQFPSEENLFALAQNWGGTEAFELVRLA